MISFGAAIEELLRNRIGYKLGQSPNHEHISCNILYAAIIEFMDILKLWIVLLVMGWYYERPNADRNFIPIDNA